MLKISPWVKNFPWREIFVFTYFWKILSFLCSRRKSETFEVKKSKFPKKGNFWEMFIFNGNGYFSSNYNEIQRNLTIWSINKNIP